MMIRLLPLYPLGEAAMNYLLENPMHIFVLLVVLFVFVSLVSFAASDARLRGKSPWLVSLIVILFFPLGLIAWLLFRPVPADGTGDPGKLKLDDRRIQ